MIWIGNLGLGICFVLVTLCSCVLRVGEDVLVLSEIRKTKFGVFFVILFWILLIYGYS